MGICDLKEEKTIRRNLRGASMTADCLAGSRKHSLESVKKTRQVAGADRGARARPAPFGRDPLTRSGYAVADSPGNETPRDADCGAVRRHAADPVCDVMVP